MPMREEYPEGITSPGRAPEAATEERTSREREDNAGCPQLREDRDTTRIQQQDRTRGQLNPRMAADVFHLPRPLAPRELWLCGAPG